MNRPTYRISDDGKSITCLVCGRTSYNPHDIAEHYCGFCHFFHDDPPPALARRRDVSRPPGGRRRLRGAVEAAGSRDHAVQQTTVLQR